MSASSESMIKYVEEFLPSTSLNILRESTTPVPDWVKKFAPKTEESMSLICNLEPSYVSLPNWVKERLNNYLIEDYDKLKTYTGYIYILLSEEDLLDEEIIPVENIRETLLQSRKIQRTYDEIGNPLYEYCESNCGDWSYLDLTAKYPYRTSGNFIVFVPEKYKNRDYLLVYSDDLDFIDDLSAVVLLD